MTIRLLRDAPMPPEALVGIAEPPRRVILPERLARPGGELDAPGVLRHVAAAARAERGDASCVVLLTTRPLLARCGRVFGYSDRRRGVAAVSLATLDEGVDASRAAARLRNVLLHEVAHVRGARHCARRECLMRAASLPEDVDARNDTACARCGRRTDRDATPHRGLRALAASASIAAAVLVADAVLGLAGPPPQFPFT